VGNPTVLDDCWPDEMTEESPAELRAKIAHYRQMLRTVDDPALRKALEELIHATRDKLGQDHEP